MNTNDHFKALRDSATRDGDLYVLEWDLAVTEDELWQMAEIRAQIDAARVGLGGRPLMQAVDDQGEPSLWPVGTDVTYTFDEQSFDAGELATVRAALATACADWHDVVPVVHIRPAADDEESVFVVRKEASYGSTIARAFFPHYPPERRILKVYTAFFTLAQRYPHVGVLRHELGHVLGFRHEHIRPEADHPTREPVGGAQPLTEYDRLSVMHYPYPGEDGPFPFTLSEADRRGARLAYGLEDA